MKKNRRGQPAILLKLTHDIFDYNGRFKIFGKEWDDDWIQTRPLKLTQPPRDPDLDTEPDDIPF